MQLKNYLQKLKILWNPLLFFQIIWTNRFLLRSLVVRNIASRYRGSFLGLIWSFVHPLMMLCVYTFVFSVVFKARWGIDTGGGRGAFAIIMFCGMAMFNIFSESVSNSCGVVVANPNFVKKVIFPLEILPLAQVAASLILGMVWFVLLFLGTIFIFGKISFTMLLLPLVLLPLAIFSLGISYFVASLGLSPGSSVSDRRHTANSLFHDADLLSAAGGPGAFPRAAAEKDRTLNSYSYEIGRTITWPFRIRKFFAVLETHK